MPNWGPVTGITLWMECFSILAGVLTTKYAAFAPEFMAYQRTIVHAQRTFAGDGWSTYDMSYRRNAAARKSLHWSHIDFNLYNEIFTGAARALQRCKLCSSEYHKTQECYLADQYSYSSSGHITSSAGHAATVAVDICHLFNTRSGNQCRYKPCRYIHVCSNCHGYHPASACTSGKPPPPKQQRSNFGPRDLKPYRK